jgi:5-methylthioadenosine/S-adenosylhomocysteine deaminase
MHVSYKTLINASIITMNDQAKYHPVGMIVIKDNRIESVGPLRKSHVKGEVIDLEGKIILPGFINTHTHTHSPLFRGVADDKYLMDWLTNYMWPAEKHMTSDDAYNAARMSLLELTASGVTMYADQFYFADAITKAAEESGLRALITPSVFSRGNAETTSPLNAAKTFIEKHVGNKQSLIIPGIGPHAVYSCNKETLEAVRDIALKHDLIVHIHISETYTENKDTLLDHAMSPTQYLKSIGLLDCKVLSAHNIHLDDKDIAIYKEKDVKVSYNPVSNLKLVSGYMPYKKLKDAGLDISLALDGVQSNNAFDILSDLKTGILIQKMKENNPTLLDAYEALKLITINAAKCLYMDQDLGSLEPGKYADLTIIDKTHPNMWPLHHDKFDMVISSIVYSATTKDVSDVMVNGVFVYKDRIHKKLPKKAVIAACQASSRRILEKIAYFD